MSGQVVSFLHSAPAVEHYGQQQHGGGAHFRLSLGAGAQSLWDETLPKLPRREPH